MSWVNSEKRRKITEDVNHQIQVELELEKGFNRFM